MTATLGNAFLTSASTAASGEACLGASLVRKQDCQTNDENTRPNGSVSIHSSPIGFEITGLGFTVCFSKVRCDDRHYSCREIDLRYRLFRERHELRVSFAWSRNFYKVAGSVVNLDACDSSKNAPCFIDRRQACEIFVVKCTRLEFRQPAALHVQFGTAQFLRRSSVVDPFKPAISCLGCHPKPGNWWRCAHRFCHSGDHKRRCRLDPAVKVRIDTSPRIPCAAPISPRRISRSGSIIARFLEDCNSSHQPGTGPNKRASTRAADRRRGRRSMPRDLHGQGQR